MAKAKTNAKPKAKRKPKARPKANIDTEAALLGLELEAETPAMISAEAVGGLIADAVEADRALHGLERVEPKDSGKRPYKERGRPTKYDPKMCGEVVELMRKGKTQEQLCSELDIVPSTFNIYLGKYEEFSKAYQEGLVLAKAWWLDRIQTAAFRPSQLVNSKLIQMVMQNCYGWREKSDIDSRVEDNTKKNKDALNKLSPKDIKAMAKILDRKKPKQARPRATAKKGKK